MFCFVLTEHLYGFIFSHFLAYQLSFLFYFVVVALEFAVYIYRKSRYTLKYTAPDRATGVYRSILPRRGEDQEDVVRDSAAFAKRSMLGLQ